MQNNEFKIAVFPGSFDPFTKGHYEIVERACSLFDKIIVAIGTNSTKQYLFPIEKRIEMIEQAFKQNAKVEVVSYSGLTVDFCKQQKAKTIVRGLRNASDFEYEQPIAQMNKTLDESIETIFISCSPQLSHISSTIIREIYKNKGNILPYLPAGVSL
ncbi:MAG: pantetheine-phosphate adenylyltransferase [Bacteroidota bacterium]